MKMIDPHHNLLDSKNTIKYDTSATAKSIVETVKDLCKKYPNLKTWGDELGKYFKDNDQDIVKCLEDNQNE